LLAGAIEKSKNWISAFRLFLFSQVGGQEQEHAQMVCDVSALQTYPPALNHFLIFEASSPALSESLPVKN